MTRNSKVEIIISQVHCEYKYKKKTHKSNFLKSATRKDMICKYLQNIYFSTKPFKCIQKKMYVFLQDVLCFREILHRNILFVINGKNLYS